MKSEHDAGFSNPNTVFFISLAKEKVNKAMWILKNISAKWANGLNAVGSALNGKKCVSNFESVQFIGITEGNELLSFFLDTAQIWLHCKPQKLFY